MADAKDMNGLWSGMYEYKTAREPVRFTAWFDDRSGVLGGTISEPNTFVAGGPEELDARIAGVRDGLVVDFIKTYSRSSSAHQSPIQYEGEADSAFTQVRGVWRLGGRDRSDGRFSLSRVTLGLERALAKPRLAEVKR